MSHVSDAAGPWALLRLEASIVARVRRAEALGALAQRAVAMIVVGASAYGAAFGLWRDPLAALASALKLPALVLAVAASTSLASALLAPLLRASLSFRQTAVLVLLGFAVTSAVLGAVAPVAILVVLSLPPPDPAVVGLAAGDPAAAPSMATAQGLVLAHTATIALAGVTGVLRTMRALRQIEPRASVVHRVVLAWLSLQLLVGAQLAWVARPFQGSPILPVRLSAPDALEGSFFEEIARLSAASFGAASPWVLGGFVLGVAGWLASALLTPPERVAARVSDHALAIEGPLARSIAWRSVRDVRRHGREVRVRVVVDGTLFEDVLVIATRSANEAAALATSMERAMAATAAGPFRSPAS